MAERTNVSFPPFSHLNYPANQGLKEKMGEVKVFTLKEANDMLPRIGSMVQSLQEMREAILKKEIEIDAMELVSDDPDQVNSPSFQKKVEEYNACVNRFYTVLEEMHETGCFLKDLDMGLVDFYSLHNGEMVYLCWKLGEKQIEFWHEVDRGFDQRKPLE